MKVIKTIAANLPLLVAFGAAFYCGFGLRNNVAMGFFIIIGAFIIVLRELYEIRHQLNHLILGDDKHKGRHSDT